MNNPYFLFLCKQSSKSYAKSTSRLKQNAYYIIFFVQAKLANLRKIY